MNPDETTTTVAQETTTTVETTTTAAPEPTTTTAEVTTTTGQVTTTTEAPPVSVTVTWVDQVPTTVTYLEVPKVRPLGSRDHVETTLAPPVVVAARVLPNTGVDTVAVVLLGAALMVAGALTLRKSRAVRSTK